MLVPKTVFMQCFKTDLTVYGIVDTKEQHRCSHDEYTGRLNNKNLLYGHCQDRSS